eukprot:CAMPEP_0179465464 /NCGR_PEP_ID=MMETSP0799-20121207/47019_1 /TAXON_ID=46947 /ORGANISM="Geminigera cryophila, Strain CCMP2564" /LENGTH=204 /DNA_ID=CAMNT_0021269751 /DNA_START=409 /DNA_END=1023 /DNA_ORIENTATION=-
MARSPLRPLAAYKVTASPEAGSELVLSAHGLLLGGAIDAGRVEVGSGSRGSVTNEGVVSISGTVDETEMLANGKVLPLLIEEFVLSHAPLIMQACVVVSSSGDVVVVAVPDYEALFKLHETRTNAEFKVAPAHLLADYSLRELCEKQMDHVMHVLRTDPTLVTPSVVPTKYLLVSDEFTVADGTLSPLSMLEPRRHAVARLHVP